MHSLWQKNINFPEYPILKKDQETDILYIGATLQHAIEGHFSMEEGKKVIIIEKHNISQMSELGGMGILRAGTKEEQKDLHRLRDYIAGRDIPCDMKVQTDTCIWVHPVKLFLFLTKDMKVYEQTSVVKIKPHRVDTGIAYVRAKKVVQMEQKKSFYVHVFHGETFPEIKDNYQVMRRYQDAWLIANQSETLEGEDYHWKI